MKILGTIKKVDKTVPWTSVYSRPASLPAHSQPVLSQAAASALGYFEANPRCIISSVHFSKLTYL